MRKLNFLLLLFFVCTMGQAQTWEWIRYVDSTALDRGITLDVHFTHPDTGFVMWTNHGNTQLRRTYDQGHTWSGPLLTLPGFNGDVEVAANGVLLVADFGGRIFRSTNNGDTWTMVSEVVSTSVVGKRAFHMFDDQYGYYSGMFFEFGQTVSDYDSAFVLLTDDAGQTWNYHRIPGRYPGKFSMTDQRILWGGTQDRHNVAYSQWDSTYVIRSTDQGQNWSILDPGTSLLRGTPDAYPHGAPTFLNDSIAFWFPGYYLPYLHRSVDGGQTWVYDSTWSAFAALIQEVHFVNDSEGVALSGPTDPTGHYMYRTHDAGVTWESMFGYEFPCFQAAYGYHFYDDHTLYLAGYPGVAKVTDYMGDSTSCTTQPVGIREPFASEPQTLSLFPNPAHQQVRIEWGIQKDPVHLQLWDAQGRLVKDLGEQSGNNFLECEIGELPQGLYFFVLQSPNGFFSARFQKI